MVPGGRLEQPGAAPPHLLPPLLQQHGDLPQVSPACARTPAPPGPVPALDSDPTPPASAPDSAPGPDPPPAPSSAPTH